MQLSHEILMRQLALGSEDKPFVVVGVIRTDGPTAIKTGNKAIILADGSIEGWVGGHCTETEIVSNALASLKDGNSRALNLTTCQGGRMDVYLEPYLPKRKLIVLGHVPIVEALSKLGKMLNFSVTVVDKQATQERFPDADNVLKSLKELGKVSPHSYAVVASMGERDQELVSELLKLGVPYVGVVAGKKRATELTAYLRASGTCNLSAVRAPAGIYIRAVTAEEIALSIMSEIVELSRAGRTDPREIMHENRNDDPQQENIAIDPVCGMTVGSDSQYFSIANGERVPFCCEACKQAFESEPEKYVLEQKNS